MFERLILGEVFTRNMSKRKCNHQVNHWPFAIPWLSEAHGAATDADATRVSNSPPSLVNTPACMAARHTEDAG